MKPNLTLPPVPADSKSNFPSQPLDVQVWLTRLPTLDTHTTLEMMQDGLSRLVHLEMTSKERYQCLDHFRRTVTNMGLKFQRYLVGLSLPLSQPTLEVASDYGRLYGTLAAGYKRIILDEAEGKPRGLRMAAVSYWAMYYLMQQLRCFFGSYSPTPKGVWFEIHQLYDYARFLSIQHELIKVGGDRERSLTHLYKRALLVGLSDPYHLPFRAADRVYDALDRWAERAELRSERTSSANDCLFLVDADLDRPAMPVLANIRIKEGTNRLLLDTSNLVVYLKRKMTRTYNETMVRSTKSADTDWFVTFDQVETLQNLIVKWGLHPIRRSPRNTDAVNHDCEVVAGLSSVHYVLNGHQPLPQRRLGDRRVSSSLMMGSFGLAQTEHERALDKKQRWRIQDESERGVRLVLEDTHQAQVRVGEIVAFKVAARFEDWTLGVIRWARTLENGYLSVGIHKIATNALPVAVQLMADRQGSINARYLPALVIPKRQGETRECMVTDQSIYRLGEHIWIEANGKNRIVEPLRVIMTTRSFVCFQFKTAAATDNQETLELVQPFPRAPSRIAGR